MKVTLLKILTQMLKQVEPLLVLPTVTTYDLKEVKSSKTKHLILESNEVL